MSIQVFYKYNNDLTIAIYMMKQRAKKLSIMAK